MKTKLSLQWFIEQHKNWESLLKEKPYCLSISRDRLFERNLILFKYNQIDTVWSESGQIAKEARGIILDEDTSEVVSYAFDKFFNSNEIYADKIDASSMNSSVKIDGSICKITLIGENVLISTNGTIDAYKAPVGDQVGCTFKSFGEIAENVICDKFGSLEEFKKHLEKGYTYIFELVSPWTRVVTPYPKNDLYLIGCRNNNTLQEIFFKDCKLSNYFKTPDIMDFSSINKCLEYAQSLDWTNEGFVVMDKDFHRVKVKNASWLAVHHLCDNHTMSYERAIDIVKANELDEVLTYFPEFKEHLEKIRDDYNGMIRGINEANNRFLASASSCETRKDFALLIQKEFGKFSGVGFALLDKKVASVEDWIKNCTSKNIVKYLGYKE